MKFSKSHRKDLLQLIEACGQEEHLFEFVKSRGRIHMYRSGTDEFFSFIQVNESNINPITKAFEEQHQFKVRTQSDPEFVLEDWAAVKTCFKDWLNKL